MPTHRNLTLASLPVPPWLERMMTADRYEGWVDDLGCPIHCFTCARTPG